MRLSGQLRKGRRCCDAVRLIMRRVCMGQALCPEPSGEFRVFGFPRNGRVVHERPWSPEQLVLAKKCIEGIKALQQSGFFQNRRVSVSRHEG